MDNSLTISTLTFDLSYNGPTGSKRLNISRGANLPDVLTIRSQPYVDSQTKLSGIRTAVVLERHLALVQNAGVIAPLKCQVVVSGPTDSGIVSADYDAVVNQMINLLGVAANTNALDLKNEIFVGKQQ